MLTTVVAGEPPAGAGMKRPRAATVVGDGSRLSASRAASGPVGGTTGAPQMLDAKRRAASCSSVELCGHMPHKGGRSQTRLSEAEAKKWLLTREKKDYTRFR